LQGEQAPLLQLSDRQSAIGESGFVLQTEAADPHANPLIEVPERAEYLGDAEVVGKSSDDRIKVTEDRIDVPPLLSTSHKADTVFELFQGTVSDFKAEASKAKPQEVKSLLEIRETSFGLMEREFEDSEGLLGVSQSENRFLGRFGQDDEVVSVSDMPPAFGRDLLIKGVEDNVGEQWRDDAPLRSTLSRDTDDPVVTDSRLEEGLKKPNDTAVCDSGTNAGYHNLMVNSVEEGGDVCVNDAHEAISCVLNCGCDSVVRFATWSEAETSFREMRFEDRGQDLIDRLLAHAVDYDRNTQRALLLGVGRLGDVDAANRMRFEAVFHELAL
jgi:hypothetical protein